MKKVQIYNYYFIKRTKILKCDALTAYKIADKEKCSSLEIDSVNASSSIPRFDNTFVSMMYVCATTLEYSNENSTITLRRRFGDFLTRYFQNEKSGTDGYKTYLTSRKFRGLEIEKENQNFHKVPRYTIPEVKQLAKNLYKRFELYWEIASAIKIKVNDLQIEAREITRQFSIIEQEQTIYFQREKELLEEIASFSEKSWKWSFDHR